MAYLQQASFHLFSGAQIMWQLQTADFCINTIVFPFMLPPVNPNQINLSAIQANLSDIQANRSAL